MQNASQANSPYNYIHYEKNSQPTIASWLTKLFHYLKTIQKVPDTRRGEEGVLEVRRRAATSHDPCGHKHSAVSTCWSRCALGCEVDGALWTVLFFLA